MTSLFRILIAACVMWAIIFYIACDVLSQPVVQFSTSTGQCVRVLGLEGDCANLPAKYNKEYIR